MATFNPAEWAPGHDENGDECWCNKVTGIRKYGAFPPKYLVKTGALSDLPTAPPAGSQFFPRSGLVAEAMWKKAVAEAWTEYRDDYGTSYWYNAMSEETTWDKPDTYSETPHPPSAQPAPKTKFSRWHERDQWRQTCDSKGLKYWYNEKTGAIQYKPPDCIMKYRWDVGGGARKGAEQGEQRGAAAEKGPELSSPTMARNSFHPRYGQDAAQTKPRLGEGDAFGVGGAAEGNIVLGSKGERRRDRKESPVSTPVNQGPEEKDKRAFHYSSEGSGDTKISRSREDSISALDSERGADNIPDTMDVEEDGLKTSPEEGMVSGGVEYLQPSSRLETTAVAQDDILTKFMGPGPKIYVSKAHAVELELQAGSLDAELPVEISITQRLAFVECRTEGVGRAPFGDGASAEEFLAMTFVNGPEGLSFTDNKPAKLRFFLGCVDDVEPDEDGSDQDVVADEDIEREILETYRTLSSPDGENNWTTLGSNSVVVRRLDGEREVWLETPVYHFSTITKAMKAGKSGNNQSYFYEDLGTSRWGWKGSSSVPKVYFGNTTKNCAIFTYFPIVEHSEASIEREVHANVGAAGVMVAGGHRFHSSAVGRPLPASREIVTLHVASGAYEKCDLSYDVKKHSQMHVKVGIIEDIVGEGPGATGKLQLLDLRKFSGNTILVLREARLKLPSQFRKIDWPCNNEDIFNCDV
eukprot:g13859.t2